MTALVTGGTGHVGGAIVRELLRQGVRVRVLARQSSRTDHLERLRVEIAHGDILEPPSLPAALAGCDTLFHTAAIYEYWVPDPQVLIRTEVDGTRNVLEAARNAGLSTVAYTSTALTVGEPRGTTGVETTKHRGYFLTRYEHAKYQAERVAEAFRGQFASLAILKPGAVLGPGDRKSTGEGFIAVLNGKIPAHFEGAIATVHVDDVARAHVRAAAMRSNQDFILAGDNVSTQELFGMVCRLGGMRMPPMIPVWIARTVAHIEETRARLMGGRPILAVEVVKQLSHGFRVDGSKAARELGIDYTPLEETLRQAIQWYWDQGLLTRKPACAA